MISKLKAVLDDDRGVSPVIGVILMVAITVILAAVIGTFVLGLGDSLEQAPQAQLDAESSSANTITISHNGGDSIVVDDLRISVEGNSADFTVSSDVSTGDEFSVGGSVEFADGDDGSFGTWSNGDYTVQIIHEPSESILLDTEVTVP